MTELHARPTPAFKNKYTCNRCGGSGAEPEATQADLEGVTSGDSDEVIRLKARVAELEKLVDWAGDTLLEINVSNYDHADVCSLNDASVEVGMTFDADLKKRENEAPISTEKDPEG